jgi:hypothetical protein
MLGRFLRNPICGAIDRCHLKAQDKFAAVRSKLTYTGVIIAKTQSVERASAFSPVLQYADLLLVIIYGSPHELLGIPILIFSQLLLTYFVPNNGSVLPLRSLLSFSCISVPAGMVIEIYSRVQ